MSEAAATAGRTVPTVAADQSVGDHDPPLLQRGVGNGSGSFSGRSGRLARREGLKQLAWF